MSENFELLGNMIIYPKLNVMVLNRNGERRMLNLNFIKWYFLSTVLFGAYHIFRILRKIPVLIKKIYYRIKPKLLEKKRHVIIYGFGDSLQSIILTKVLIANGYELILINKKKEFDFRKKYSLNKKEGIKELDNLDFFLSYEDIAKNPDLIKQKIGNNKVDFIFDFSSYGVNFDLDNHVHENKKFGNTYNTGFNNRFSDKSLNVYEKEDEKVSLLKNYNTAPGGFGNCPKDFSSSNNNISSYHSDLRTYNSNEVIQHLFNIMNITEFLIPFMQNTKVFIFNYLDRCTEVNHKLLVDYKQKFFENLKRIPSEAANFIFYIKKISAYLNNRHRNFTENDALNIICFSDLESYQYSFI